MKNLTLNDSTQKAILKHLTTTEDLLGLVASKLSGTVKKAYITAMPDLGIAHNVTRMMGGFFTGACYSWNTDVPFIPIDATINVCGTAVFKLSKEISTNTFLSKVNTVLKDTLRYTWNYCNGNHFIMLAKSNGNYGLEPGYYMIVHASANEFKYGENGLYPGSDVWYSNEIKTEYLPNSSRYLRYIYGDTAIKFYKKAKELISFNTERNRFFINSVLGNEYLEKEILSIQHYGMPNDHTVCIGAHWEPTTYTLLTAPGKPIFLINPDMNLFEGSPHGLGLSLKNSIIKFNKDNITLGQNNFSTGENINIGTDALNRCSADNEDIDRYVSKIINVCPGNIVGKLEQIVSISKDGTKIWNTTGGII